MRKKARKRSGRFLVVAFIASSFFDLKSLNLNEEVIIEMKCPACGADVKTPIKEWDMGRLHVKMYEHCGKKFREYKKK